MFLARKTGASVVCSQVRHTSLVWFLNQVFSVQVIIRPRQINFTLNEKIIYMKKFAGSKFVSKTVPQCNWTLTDLVSGKISLRYLIGSYVFLLFICKSQCFEILAFYFLVFALFSSFCSLFTKTCIALSQSVSRIFSCILLRQLHVPAH